MAPHDRLLMRKIAHATRNARVTAAMSLEQAHAAMRAGMEIADKLRGNVTILAGVGVGAQESAALVLSRLTDSPVRDLVVAGPQMDGGLLAHLLTSCRRPGAAPRCGRTGRGAGGLRRLRSRGDGGRDPDGRSKRQLLMIDGLPACAALMLASRIAQPVTDYCVFCRSHGHAGWTRR